MKGDRRIMHTVRVIHFGSEGLMTTLLENGTLTRIGQACSAMVWIPVFMIKHGTYMGVWGFLKTNTPAFIMGCPRNSAVSTQAFRGSATLTMESFRCLSA